MSKLRPFNLFRFLIIYIPLLILSYWGVTYYYNSILKNESEIVINSELDELKIKKIILTDFFSSLAEDIDLLTWEYEHSAIKQTDGSGENANDFFMRFASIQRNYDQVRILDTLGNEMLRIDYEESNQAQLVKPQNLQQKSDRYYFKRAKKLKANEIYFSNIDLNIEHGKIEIPYNPVIRAARKIYDHKGDFNGIIITNYFINKLANKLLLYDENINSSFQLINKNGYWLIAGNPDKTFGHIKPGCDSINIKYSHKNLWSKIETQDEGFCKSKQNTYVFLKFSPRIQTEFNDKYGIESDEEYTLVSELKNQDLSQNYQFYKTAKWLSFLFLALLFAAIIIGVQYSRYRLEQKNKILTNSEEELSFLKNKLERTLQLKLEELSLTERKFFSLFNNAGIGVTLVDLSGRPVFSNKTLEKMLGYSAEELSKMTFQEFTHPDYITKDTKLFNQLINREIGSYNIEKKYLKSDGTTIWGDLNVSLLLDKNNEIVNVIATVSEISERKKYEEQLFDNAQLLNQVYEAVISTDKNDILTYCNTGAVELLGYEPYEIIGRDIGILCGQEDNCQTMKQIHTNLSEKRKLLTELLLQKKDGSRFHAQLSLSHRYNSSGNNIGRIYSITDITLQKENEQKIRQINNELEERVELRTAELKKSYQLIKDNEYRLNAAFQGTEYGWWDYKTKEGVLLVHKSKHEMLGYEKSETKKSIHWWYNLAHPDDQKNIDLLNEKLKSGKITSFNHEIRIRNKEGNYIWIYDRGTVIEKDEQGRPKRIIGTTQNINQRKINELNLLKLSMAVKQSPGAVVITDTNARIEYVNRAFEKLTGYKKEEVLRKNPKILNAGVLPSSVYKDLWKTILGGEAWEGELCNRTKNGKIFWENTTITPVINEEGKIINFIAVKEDITERRKFVEQLKLAKQDAEAANKAKSEFLANMSHEIRTPMNAVIGFTDILSRQIKDETQLQYLNSIKVSGKNLLSIINDILDLSKIESGKITLDYGKIGLKELVNELKTIFETQAENKGISFTVTIGKTSCNSIISDEVRVRQILFNLISNAIKFTEQGEVNVTLQAVKNSDQKNSEEKNTTIQFIIQDSGIGVKKDMQEKIFESFVQQDGQDSKKYGGTGLGLPISRKLAQLLGGDISLTSEYKKGSTFIFSLYNVKCSGEQIKNQSQSLITQTIVFKPNRVLVIDDIKTNRDYLKIALNELGLKISTANDGLQGLKIVEEEKIDLILCDIKMPNLDGYGFIERLRNSTFKNIPCIATTASALNKEIEQLNNYDFDQILLKPIQIEELSHELKKHIPFEINTTHKETQTAARFELSKEEFNKVKDELPKKIIPLWKELKKQQAFDDLNKFADLILQLGTKHNIDTLSGFARNFRSAIDEFDIEKIVLFINQFETIAKN